jgi:protein-S-isoprenylcysteine O-methyltransferase Ste14
MRSWNILFLAGFIVYVTIRGVYKQRTKANQLVVRRVDALEKALMIIVIPGGLLLPLIYLLTPWLAFADYSLPTFAPWCGLPLMLAALWLFWKSHADLGLNWSQSLEVRTGHQLITRGVYRSIRHPMYASIFLWCLAQGLMLANWLAGWYALAAFAVMYFVRTPREERMMRDTFGQQYVEYARRTGRLFPKAGWIKAS